MEFENKAKAEEVYCKLLKEIAEGDKQANTLYLWSPKEVKLLLKEEMLSAITSSNYKSECFSIKL